MSDEINYDEETDKYLVDKTVSEKIEIVNKFKTAWNKKEIDKITVDVLFNELDVWRNSKITEIPDNLIGRAIGRFLNKYYREIID